MWTSIWQHKFQQHRLSYFLLVSATTTTTKSPPFRWPRFLIPEFFSFSILSTISIFHAQRQISVDVSAVRLVCVGSEVQRQQISLSQQRRHLAFSTIDTGFVSNFKSHRHAEFHFLQLSALFVRLLKLWGGDGPP